MPVGFSILMYCLSQGTLVQSFWIVNAKHWSEKLITFSPVIPLQERYSKETKKKAYLENCSLQLKKVSFS